MVNDIKFESLYDLLLINKNHFHDMSSNEIRTTISKNLPQGKVTQDSNRFPDANRVVA